MFFVGPEGDFTFEELSEATDKGCIPVSLGENVLKVDTAAVAISSIAHLIFNL